MGFGSAFRRKAALIAVATLAAGGLAACGSSDSDSDADTTSAAGRAASQLEARIAIIPAFGSLPLHIADTKGMFERQGLRATLTPTQDAVAAVAALGKQFDIALGAPTIMISGAARNLPVRALSGLQVVDAEHPNSVLVSQRPIESYADLEGGRVGVIALSGASYASMLYLLERAGVDPRSVRFIPTPVPTMADQVRAGRLDAAVSAVPFFTGLEGVSVGDTDILADAFSEATDGAQRSAQSAIMISTTDWAQDNPDAVRAYRTALAEAMDWIEANPEEARRELGAWLRLDQRIADEAPMPRFSPTISARELQPFIDIGNQVGTLPPSVPDAETLLIPGADQQP